MALSGEDLRDLYARTVVVRRPRYGIVRGYHELPYICLSQSWEAGSKTTSIRGTVHVSPRFVIRPEHLNPSYGDIFGDENVNVELAGRVFGFLGFRGKPVECSSEGLDVAYLDDSVDAVLAQNLDQLDRHEDITTGVIIAPDSRYYPVSIERFISSILEDEFSV